MPDRDPHTMLAEVEKLREHVLTEGQRLLDRWQPLLRRGAFATGAQNLAHYLAFRELDLRSIQQALVTWGLSTLGRSERRVMPTIDAVLANLRLICGANTDDLYRPSPADFERGLDELKKHTQALFGPPNNGRETRIMVTMSGKAAKDKEHVRGLIAAGMDVARINCAHDGPDIWAPTIENIRGAAKDAGRECPVLMDLQGPKIRTRDVVTPKDRKAVRAGDHILLVFGKPSKKHKVEFQASCAMPEVLQQIGVGAAVSIKDGLILGRVETVREEGLLVRVTRTPPDGQPLQEEKGINFPGTTLRVSSLTDDDLQDLEFVALNADMVGYSFVQVPGDLALLQEELRRRRGERPPLGIVAKIETQLAFDNLPDLIVQGAGANPFAVMIARGDLAVEIGYERLSEVQEEILWVCEAACVPVIWATQVLESLVKRGMPSRGEFTDAAMGNRAECVMLNKGAYVAEGVTVLDNVLRRMERHMRKKSPQLRALGAWAGLH